jgi:hypothetical protein
VLTVTEIGVETGFFDFSSEQPEEKKTKRRNPGISVKKTCECFSIRAPDKYLKN